VHTALLQVENLCVRLPGSAESVIRDVAFSVKRGEKTAILGESGCGKSLTALALFRLLPAGMAATGTARFEGRLDLLQLPDRELRPLRGREIVLIPQGGMTHLNPVLSVGYQMAEALRRAGVDAPAAVRAKTLDLLARVGLPDPPRISRMYPHELSGGMAQRVLLAAGMAGQPALVVADEPTRGLDEDVKMGYVALLKEVYREAGVLLITHDFQVAAACERLIVMYAGEVVEAGPTETILSHPAHPYTAGLLASLPQSGLQPIPGQPPSMRQPPAGCRFHPRCGMADAICSRSAPPPISRDGVMRRCFFA
jgi:peptide/nickel transport system ATP-binding protein